MVANKLDAQLRARSNLFVESSSDNFSRPCNVVLHRIPMMVVMILYVFRFKRATVLVLVDRNVDLQVPLQHAWTYQALAHDLLKLNNNQVQVQVENESGIAFLLMMIAHTDGIMYL